jgi:hypothetical protein
VQGCLPDCTVTSKAQIMECSNWLRTAGASGFLTTSYYLPKAWASS